MRHNLNSMIEAGLMRNSTCIVMKDGHSSHITSEVVDTESEAVKICIETTDGITLIVLKTWKF